MAVVKAPALSLDASGNVGGIQYSKWRGMHIAREVAPGTQPNTALQQAVQSKLSTVITAWGSTLTEVQRQAWRDYAKDQVWMTKLKDPYIPTGYHVFVKHNCIRQQMGLSVLTVPIVDTKNPDVMLIDVPNEGLSLKQTLRLLASESCVPPDYAEADKYEFFQAGPYDSPGRQPIDGEWRLVEIVAEDTDAETDALTTGKYYWFKGRTMLNSGKVGNFFRTQVYVEYNPLNITDCVLWVDKDQGVTGDPVTNWDDLSDDDNDWNGINPNEPTVGANGIAFDGATQYFLNDNPFITDDMWQRSQDWTGLFVIRKNFTAGNGYLIGIENTTDGVSLAGALIRNAQLYDAVTQDRFSIIVRDSTNNQIDEWMTDNSKDVPDLANCLLGVRQTGSIVELFINDTTNRAFHRTSGAIDGANFHNNKTMMGCREDTVGGRKTFYKGEVIECVVYEDSITDCELYFLIKSLKDRHSIA